MGPRRNSRHRPSRGSVMGRSVVSTHIYSSIPASPETNIITLKGGGVVGAGSNSTLKDPSPTTPSAAGSGGGAPGDSSNNLLTVNGTSSGIVTLAIPADTNNSITNNTNKVSPNNGSNETSIKSSLKNRKNHASSNANGNAISMYVSSEYGSSVKGNPGVEISCV